MSDKNKNVGFNVSSFVNGSEENKNLSVKSEVEVVETKKRTRKACTDLVPAQTQMPMPQTSMSYIQENIPYQMAYNETNNQLDEAIQQLNVLSGETMGDIQMVRASRTLKNKYGIINDMTENAVGIINAKIAAIREKNKTIGDINNLEIRRIKELKLQSSAEDDNTRIANMYNAFIHTPIGAGPALGPSMMETSMMGGSMIPRMDLGWDQVAWENSLDPAGRRMVLEAQGKIETVLVYDESSGNRYFSVVDKVTRQPIPGIEVPSQESAYSVDINLRAGTAHDRDRNTVYPLLVINGGNSTINQY